MGQTKTGLWKVACRPTSPAIEVLPHGPPPGAELAPPHDLGADVVGEVAGEVVVEAAGATRVGAVGPAPLVAPAQEASTVGSAWPKGRSMLWPSPVPYPSVESMKFCTRRSCSAGAVHDAPTGAAIRWRRSGPVRP